MVYKLVKESNYSDMGNINIFLVGSILVILFYLLFRNILKMDVVRTGIINSEEINKSENNIIANKASLIMT